MSENLGEPLRMTALARLAGLSTAHFGVLFKEQTGSSPRDYLHLLRIHKACQLLRASNLQIKEIAARLGYQDQFHFSRQFKAFEGVSPSDYRARKSPPASG
jgi:transcriptional regulator GlxA family with amidase domain